ncbi:NAD(P)H-binding protein [Streptomyces capoamus]|uniref:Nucleotide-diphosphate-sugar epimerase n=1 Tax=Streptomyces capoamus TaxID=68183 RepID=A0A919C7A4_9ACTN|nr:NAD(P)H-binding protein [Streptomyces capoamus]GGW19101.1 nucleotide-diphosphate-sugar epimerase [Streptomyces libani subsp. rufus]GHG48749.1 nucleotide-diphosphate-sugar epimerase [Streptomyces capoamus]
MNILLTGATGKVGRHVTEGVVARGHHVRALTRTPGTAGLPAGVEVVQGDLEQPGTVAAALEGIDRMYLFPVPETVHEVVALARKAGVRHIVVLSSSSVLEDESNPSHQHHRTVERAVEDSGADWTFVRPDEFAGNVLWKWGESIRTEGVVRAPYGKAARAIVHEADIAAVVAAALLEDGHAGAQYVVTGPRALTQVEQVGALSEALGREIRFEELSREAGREAMSRVMPPPVVEMLLDYLAASAVTPGPVTDVVRKVTGREARTFASWAAEHADSFSSSS